MQSVTFSTTSLNTATRLINVVALDSNDTGNVPSNTGVDTVAVAIAAPTVTASGSTGQTFTLGGAAVAVDSGVTVSSADADLTGATETITNYQSGDSLSFTSQNGITGSYNSGTGVLTLTGSATPAQYQTALQSVTFSTASLVKGTRTIDVVADDSGDTGDVLSNTAVDSVVVAIAAPVVTPSGFQTLLSFNGTNGSNPIGGLTLIGSTLFGTTTEIAQSGHGNIFSLPVTGGTPTTLLSFSVTNGSIPYGTLLLDGSALYGTTNQGGANGGGTVFSIPVTGGSLTDLVSFNGTDGDEPNGGLTLSADGSTFYGMTSETPSAYHGTVFSIPVTGGTLTNLLSFNGTDGSDPIGSLTLDGSTLYGVTRTGGANGDGTIFSIPVTGGTLTTLLSFNGTDGANPYGPLVLVGSTLYGMTDLGGANNDGTVFSIPVTGGTPTTLVSFNGANGQNPRSSLALSADGSTLYGMTALGGADNDGTIFSIPVTGGALTTLFSFNGTNGQTPDDQLALNGSTLYGTTEAGGANGDGTVFSMNVAGSTGQTFTVGGAAVPVDSGIAVTSYDSDLTGATETIANYQSGDSLHFTSQNGITGSYSSGTGVLTLAGSATPAQYTAALQSVTFSTTSLNTTTRTINVVALDSNDTGNAPSNTGVDTVLVAIAAPTVTASGSTGQTFTLGSAAAAVDSGLTVTSYDADITGATETITNYQSGDTLSFTSQNGITGSYNSGTGVLTLAGSATPAQYQTALQSVTFSTSSTVKGTRTIDVVADDANDTGNLPSNTGVDSVVVAIGPPILTTWDVAFNGTNGATPYGDLTLSGSTLYGMTESGGAYGDGTIFSIPATGGTPTTLLSFNGTNGANPYGDLTLIGSTFYGVTYAGGANGDGTIFSIPVTGGTPTTLLSFGGSNGQGPEGDLTLSSDGSTFYGMTSSGGANGNGTIFSIPVTGGTPTTLLSFNDTNGAGPAGSLTLGADGSTLYGMTTGGGTYGVGTVFSIPVTGGSPTTLLTFNGTNGSTPLWSDLTLSGSTLYGVTSAGGANNEGIIFSIPVTGGTPTDLFSFDGTHGNGPWGSLMLSGSTLYGMTAGGGTNLDGTVFSIPMTGGTPTVLLSLNGTNGGDPHGGLTLNGSTLYGMTYNGGANGDGTIFSMNVSGAGPSGSTGQTFTLGSSAVPVSADMTVTSSDTDLTGATETITNVQSGDTLHFTSQNGITASYNSGTGVLTLSGSATPAQYTAALQSVTFSTTSTVKGTRTIDVVADDSGDTGNAPSDTAVDSVVVAIAAPVVTTSDFQTLFSFNGTNGSSPFGNLTLSGSTLYGTTVGGGTYGDGTIFSVPLTGGTPTTLVSFNGTDGNAPYGSLTISGSTIYGMTSQGGDVGHGLQSLGYGTVFSVPLTGGTPTTLFSFTGLNGAYPYGGLTLSGSTLFGMTNGGGMHEDGNVFSISTSGSGFQNLFSFSGSNGSGPVGELTLIGSTLYGTTEDGGTHAEGNIFSIPVTGGTPTTLFSFSGTNGEYPHGDLTLIGSKFYGTTEEGGTNHDGNVFSFPVTGGNPTTLLSFNGTNGISPHGNLTLIGSTLYGMALHGGANGDGTIFSIPVTGGTPTTLLSFNGTTGADPYGSLTLSGSTLYGMANAGGENGDGTVFALSAATVTAGGAAAAVDSGLTVTSYDSDLTGATETIANFQSGDSLHFTSQNGLTGSYSSGTGILTLTGTATPAQYQTALQSVTFATTSLNTTTRTINVVALDSSDTGDVPGNTGVDTVAVAIAAPVVTASGSTGQAFTLGGAAVAVDSGLTVTSFDTDVTGATETISNYQSGDTLSFTSSSGITGSYNSGTGLLTLTGTATPAQYQTALQSVTFTTSSLVKGTRTIDVVADDSGDTGDVPSNTAVNSVVVAAAAPVVTTSSFQTLLSFNGTNGANPLGGLTLSGSTLYGSTVGDGVNNEGTIFSIPVTGGAPTTLFSFEADYPAYPYGAEPNGGLTLSGSTLYGMARQDGPYYGGTIFSIPVTGGTPAPLTNFNGADGDYPTGGLTLSGSTLYGMTSEGGANYDGTLFSIPVTGGTPTTLLSFNGTDGALPYGSLTLSADGSTLYGMTANGGASNQGTIFSIPVTGGTPTILLSFNGTDGANPAYSDLTLSGSTLYGTTENGGANGDGTVFSISVTGGTPTTLLSFGGTNGAFPQGSLTLSGSTLYGTTVYGGAYGDGTLFSIPATGGTPTTLLSFNGTNGSGPLGTLALSGSTLYGMTAGGGANGDGTVFSLNVSSASPSGTSNTFTVGGSAVMVDSSVTVSSDDTDLTGATETIANKQTGDSLHFTSQNGITGSYSSSTGVLTLAGSATPAQYTAALQSVTFSTTSTNTTARTIDVVALDSGDTGNAPSNTVDDTVGVAVIAAPTVTTSGSTGQTFTVGAAAVAVDSGLTVTSSDTDLTGASMTITNDQLGDSLSFTSSSGISGSYNPGTGVLTLTGSATPAQYQAALRSVTFSTTSLNTTTRTIDVVALDANDSGSLSSNTAVNSVVVAIAAPVVTTSGFQVLLPFDGTDGEGPRGSLTLSGSTFYGMTESGGAYSDGTVFSIPVTGGTPTVLASFNGTNGAQPWGDLTLSGSTLYGMTETGGVYNDGTIFSIPASGGTPTVLLSFNDTDGANPYGDLTLSTDGSTLYGMTAGGGGYNDGTIFSISVTGGAPTTLLSFNGTNGQYPHGSLTLDGSTLLGMTEQGGANGDGTVFSIPLTGGTLTTLLSFNGTDGEYPYGSLTLSGSTLYGMTSAGTDNEGTIFSVPMTGGAPTILHSFAVYGADPLGSLTLSGSTLYGLTAADEILFSIPVTGGAMTTLHTFSYGTDGRSPQGSLTLVGSTLYGMADSGGANDDGTIFSMNTTGSTGQTFTLGGAAVAVDSGLTASSANADLSGASLTITNYQSGDSLHFTSQNGITGSYNSGTGLLTLAGSATPSQYQTALQSVTFSTTSTVKGTRTINVIVDDANDTGNLPSNTGVDTVAVAIAAPIVTASGSTGQVFGIGGASVAVDSGLMVSSADADLTGATETITNYHSGDTLNFTSASGITGSFNTGTGVLTLTGSATPGEYQTVLRSVTFSTTYIPPGGYPDYLAKDVDVVVSDANASSPDSNTALDTVNVGLGPPYLAPAGLQTLGSFGAPGGPGAPYASLTLVGSTLYGTTAYGGAYDEGTVFSIPVAGGTPTVLASFNGTDGGAPTGDLTLSGSTLYGTTSGGGANGDGTLFSIPLTGGTLTTLLSFNGTNGLEPRGGLTLIGSTLYGMTESGGANGDGNIFSISTSGSGFQNLLSFNGTNGSSPRGDLTLVGSTLYGMTALGGANNDGTLFSIPVTGGTLTTLVSFNGTDGAFVTPQDTYFINGSLTLGADGSTFYGMTTLGGTYGAGTIYSIPVTGGTPTTLFSFNNFDGGEPYGKLTLSSDGSTLYGMTQGGDIFSLPVTGGTPTTLVWFDGTNGTAGMGSLTLTPTDQRFMGWAARCSRSTSPARPSRSAAPRCRPTRA